MDDLLLALVICIGLIGFAVSYVLVAAFWYISIPLFCIYVYFKYFRKEKKFEARVLTLLQALRLFHNNPQTR